MRNNNDNPLNDDNIVAISIINNSRNLIERQSVSLFSKTNSYRNRLNENH